MSKCQSFERSETFWSLNWNIRNVLVNNKIIGVMKNLQVEWNQKT